MVTTFLRTRKKIIWVICGLLWTLWLWPGGPAAGLAAEYTASNGPSQGVSPKELNVHGVWFAAGDRQRTCSINQNNGHLSLMDEKGQVSGGRIAGPDLIEAYGAFGRVSEDGRRIDWGFGVSWTRNPTRQAPKAVADVIDISGRWYAQGNSRQRCRITQSGEVIQTIDETGRVWPGKINNQTLEGIGKKGFLTMSGTRIDWSDNTFWTRRPQKKATKAKPPEKPSPPAPAPAVPDPPAPQPAAARVQKVSPPPAPVTPRQSEATPQPALAVAPPPAPQPVAAPVRQPLSPAPAVPSPLPVTAPPVRPSAPVLAVPQIWPHLRGSWFAYGDPGRICRIEQHGQDLVFINEAGNRTPGRIVDGHTVESNGFKGFLSQDFSRIQWANHTWWVR